MADNFRVLVLGVGDAFSARYYSTSFLLNTGVHWTLIDCPFPIRKIIAEACEPNPGLHVDLDDVDDVIVTHLHADHCSGVETYGFYKRFIQRKLGALHGTGETLTNLWEHHLYGGMAILEDMVTGKRAVATPNDYYRPCEMRFGRGNPVAGASVEIRPTRHPVPTVALKIRYQDKTLGYSSDTSFDPTLIDWLKDCDLIIHETNKAPHTPLHQLVEVSAEVSERMRLIHYPDDFDLDNSPIPCTRQGELIDVT